MPSMPILFWLGTQEPYHFPCHVSVNVYWRRDWRYKRTPVSADLFSAVSVIRDLLRPEKNNLENYRNNRFISFKTRAKRERAVTWWNPAAQTRPVLDSSSILPIPTLPRKLATILRLVFLLFELVAAFSQCFCAESNKENGEVGEFQQ